MNSFVECSIAMQNFLMILLEICLILELILFLLRITCFSGKKKVITAITVFAVSFVLMVSLMNEHRYSIGESAYQPMLQDYPASILTSGIVALTLYLCWAIWKERYKYNHSLSYWSVNDHCTHFRRKLGKITGMIITLKRIICNLCVQPS